MELKRRTKQDHVNRLDNAPMKNRKKDPHILEHTSRVFNEKTEKYEYKTEIINYKNEWENEIELLVQQQLKGDNKE